MILCIIKRRLKPAATNLSTQQSLEGMTKWNARMMKKYRFADELKITKSELATKTDIKLLESKMDNMRNELIIKLGGIVVGSMTILGILMAYLVK